MSIVAYLDPGTGAIIIQSLIAGIVGLLFAVKLFWSSIKNFFLKLCGKKTEPAGSPVDAPEVAGKENESK